MLDCRADMSNTRRQRRTANIVSGRPTRSIVLEDHGGAIKADSDTRDEQYDVNSVPMVVLSGAVLV